MNYATSQLTNDIASVDLYNEWRDSKRNMRMNNALETEKEMTSLEICK